MPNVMTSSDFYRFLQSTIVEAERRVRDATGQDCGISIYAGSVFTFNNDFSIRIIDGYHNGGHREEVVGKDLWACVDEFIRRKGFASQQRALSLGPPIIDEGEAEAPGDLGHER